jgi:cytochrome d ubiquinol oxidase subunit II
MVLAALFLGFFVLDGFDFGVGMLLGPLGRIARGDPEAHRRAVLNTIGPVWDGNEVWLITAGAAMLAAFPNWYATVFSALYLPLLGILFGMILRAVAIEWRGKIDDTQWRSWADAAIGAGSWLPGILWGMVFAVMVHGLPVDAHHRVHLSVGDIINPYPLLGGLASGALFFFHGAVFLVLKTAQDVREDALRLATACSLPVTVVVATFGLWTQLAHGKTWTWWVLGVGVIAQLVAVGLVWRQWMGLKVMTGNPGEGWAFGCTTLVVAAVVVLLFGALYPNLVPSTLGPDWSVTIYNASSTPYTLRLMSWAALIFAPLVMVYQGWTYWVFRQRISAQAIPASIGLPRTAA